MDEEKALTQYEQKIVNEIDAIKELFLRKNRAYNPENPIANFAVGGILLYGDSGYMGAFEALKCYMTKHVANVYTHRLNTDSLDESMRDIATYMIIGAVMKHDYDALVKTQKQENAQNDD